MKEPLNAALQSLYGKKHCCSAKFLDEKFKTMRRSILERRKTKKYQLLLECLEIAQRQPSAQNMEKQEQLDQGKHLSEVQ